MPYLVYALPYLYMPYLVYGLPVYALPCLWLTCICLTLSMPCLSMPYLVDLLSLLSIWFTIYALPCLCLTCLCLTCLCLTLSMPYLVYGLHVYALPCLCLTCLCLTCLCLTCLCFTCLCLTLSMPYLFMPYLTCSIPYSVSYFQVSISVVVTVMEPPKAALRMPLITQPYVELTCSLPFQGFIISLSYNVLLVVVCAYYAFKTRMLPDNFNESRYISLCVYTTLLIWLAFLPSYFTATRSFYQVILLSSALLLNATVTLLCLYTPRVYAIYTGATLTLQPNKTTFSSLRGNESVATFPRCNSVVTLPHCGSDSTVDGDPQQHAQRLELKARPAETASQL